MIAVKKEKKSDDRITEQKVESEKPDVKIKKTPKNSVKKEDNTDLDSKKMHPDSPPSKVVQKKSPPKTKSSNKDEDDEAKTFTSGDQISLL